MNWNNIIGLRMERLGFSHPAGSEREYDEIFKRLQPVSTEYFTEPGRPPSIRDRSDFDDVEYNRLLRQNQDIIKARFQGSTISYVLRDELEMYASAFAKPIGKIDDAAIELYTVLNQVGPMDKPQIIEEMDLKGPVVTKILQKYQKAFMIYELQPDRFGEQVWQTFESEWPEFNIKSMPVDEARRQVVLRFIRNMVAVDSDMIRDWTRFSKRDTTEVLSDLGDRGLLETTADNTDTIYYLPEDSETVLGGLQNEIPRSVFLVHKADYYCRACESKLKEKFKGREILQYLLIDGEFNGAVEGHWRIGPHNIEDIILTIPEEERESRKADIIAAVAEHYHPPYSRILKYNGKSL